MGDYPSELILDESAGTPTSYNRASERTSSEASTAHSSNVTDAEAHEIKPCSIDQDNRDHSLEDVSQAQLDIEINTKFDLPPADENDAPDLVALCRAYLETYRFEDGPRNDGIERGKAFALALLEHIYPSSEDYQIKLSSLGPMTKFGFNYMLKESDGTDPDFTPLKPTELIPSSNKTARNRRSEIANRIKQFNHGSQYTMSVK